jgi:hypothetical protein
MKKISISDIKHSVEFLEGLLEEVDSAVENYKTRGLGPLALLEAFKENIDFTTKAIQFEKLANKLRKILESEFQNNAYVKNHLENLPQLNPNEIPQQSYLYRYLLIVLKVTVILSPIAYWLESDEFKKVEEIQNKLRTIQRNLSSIVFQLENPGLVSAPLKQKSPEEPKQSYFDILRAQRSKLRFSFYMRGLC